MDFAVENLGTTKAHEIHGQTTVVHLPVDSEVTSVGMIEISW